MNEKWLAQADSLRHAIDVAIHRALTHSTTGGQQQLCDKLKAIKVTALEREINKALGKSRPQGRSSNRRGGHNGWTEAGGKTGTTNGIDTLR